MIEFRALGPVELISDGRPLDALLAPKRLALLAYLAIGNPPQFRRRDTIVAYLWPELDADHARAALRQGIHFLRQSLGPSVLTSRGTEDVGLERDRIWCDATEFDHACANTEPSRALELYRGDLLPGFFAAGAAPEFEQWLDSERERLRRQASVAAWMAADQAVATGRHAAAVSCARRAAGLAPDDESALRRLIQLMDELGDRSGALRVYEEFARRLGRDYEAEPSTQTKTLIDAVRARARMTADARSSGSTSKSIAGNGRSEALPRLGLERAMLKSDGADIDITIAPPPVNGYVAATAVDTSPKAATGIDIAPDVVGSWTDRVVVSSADRGRRVPRRVAVLGMGFLVGLGVLFANRRQALTASVTAVAGPVRLAILPFDTQGDTSNAYFADGITDEIRAKLSQLPGLRLIASTSSNQYRHTQKPAEEIGRELGAHYLLIGHIQWEQGSNGTRRVRVSPELVEVHEGAAPITKWQETYDTTLADVFDVQSAVATHVADKLGVTLSAPARTQLAIRPTQNLAAYDTYLRSTTFPGNEPATVRRALAAAEQAVARDSGFAAAWARVSELHSLLYEVSVPTLADAEIARGAAERAVALAPTAPEGYLARGRYNIDIVHDQAAARAAFETAVQLAPSSSEANGLLAMTEGATGRWTAGLGHARLGVALDPRSADAATKLSYLFLELRRYPEARAEAERGLTLEPADLALINARAISWLGAGDLTGARGALRDVVPTLDRARIAATLAGRGHLSWALDSADRALGLTLPPSAFDNDRGVWGIARAELYWYAGDTVQGRYYADSARTAYEAQLQAAPQGSRQHLFHAVALAYLGQRAAAVREGERGLALARATGDEEEITMTQRHLAWIYVAAGDHQHAIDQLNAVLSKPHFISPAWLKIDPTWAPLRGDPRFERMVARPETSPIH